eukprot:TRINITY_DN11907_c0_g1_i1.p1 TRINITY_DN11907_c0_g1~~TRINITY_DN11907_c0_g1_i1.p1  ORF type:complete len:794 (+),score=169.81 TRINITY_DN11907_c0_g1_i1:125-2506(+)
MPGSESGSSASSQLSFLSGLSSELSGVSRVTDFIYDSEEASAFERFRNRLFTLFTHLSSHSIAPAVAGLLACVQFIQLLSFSFTLDPHTDGDFGMVETVFAEVRRFGSGNISFYAQTIVFWCMFSFLVALMLICTRVSHLLHHGQETWSRWSTVARYGVSIFGHALYLPFASYFLAAISCDGRSRTLLHFPSEPCTDGPGLAMLIGAALGLPTLLHVGLAVSSMLYSWQPSRTEYFSLTNSRIRVMLFASETVMVVLTDMQPLKPEVIRPILAAANLFFNVALLWWLLYFLPFHHLRTIQVSSVLLGTSTFGAATRFITVVAGFVSLPAEIAFYVSLVVGGAAGFGAAVWRVRSIQDRFAAIADGGEARHADGSAMFEKEFEVELASRFAWRAAQADGDDTATDQALAVFNHGLDVFPTSATIRLAQAVFLVSLTDELARLLILLRRTRRLPLPVDLRYLLVCIDTRRRDLVRNQDGGLEEITLKLGHAKKYQAECKRWIRTFWQRVSKSDDLTTLPERPDPPLALRLVLLGVAELEGDLLEAAVLVPHQVATSSVNADQQVAQIDGQRQPPGASEKDQEPGQLVGEADQEHRLRQPNRRRRREHVQAVVEYGEGLVGGGVVAVGLGGAPGEAAGQLHLELLLEHRRPVRMPRFAAVGNGGKPVLNRPDAPNGGPESGGATNDQRDVKGDLGGQTDKPRDHRNEARRCSESACTQKYRRHLDRAQVVERQEVEQPPQQRHVEEQVGCRQNRTDHLRLERLHVGQHDHDGLGGEQHHAYSRVGQREVLGARRLP